jgi:hypothetical protein
MAEQRASIICTAWVALWIIVLGVVYYVSQTAIDDHRVTLPIKAYFDCLHKVGAFDWSKIPGGKPGSSSEICKELASYR